MDANVGRLGGGLAVGSRVQQPEALSIHGLSLRRRGLLLLRELSLVVPPGQTLAVMGRSGAGKTTLLRTISGLARPTVGTVERPVERVPVVFQEPRLLPWRTTRQNVELVLGKQHRHRAEEWLRKVGLADAMDTYPLALSGGMRQRASIARALACQEPLLLVDEPFAHLDVVTAAQLREELTSQIAATGCATVWVTHDPAEAAQVAHRTLIMAGPPDGAWKLFDHPEGASTEWKTQALARELTEHLAHGPELPLLRSPDPWSNTKEEV